MTDRNTRMLDRFDTLAETERERRLMRYAADAGASALWYAMHLDGADPTEASDRISDACNELTREAWAEVLAEMREDDR